jgi:Cyclic nucleotide-binding domain
LIERLQ